MANATEYVQGDQFTVSYTATGACTNKQVRVLGAAGNVSVGVHLSALATGDVGAIDIGGAWVLPAATGAAIAQGETVNWDVSASGVDDNAATPASGDVSDFGVALEAKAAGAGLNTVKVKLLPGNGAIT